MLSSAARAAWAVLLSIALCACAGDRTGASAGSPGNSMPASAAAAELSDSVTIDGLVRERLRLDSAALRALPATSVQLGADRYTGVDLWYLLQNRAGLALPADQRNAGIALFVVATGSDGYRAVFSLAELDPALGNRSVIVVYARNGEAPGKGGAVRLVVPQDGKAARWVFGLRSLSVQQAPKAGA